MAASVERSVRGYRPSRCGLPSDLEVETERLLKLAHMERYIRRAEDRLPLFEDNDMPMPSLQGDAAGRGG